MLIGLGCGVQNMPERNGVVSSGERANLAEGGSFMITTVVIIH
jgi:hypothetical protein